MVKRMFALLGKEIKGLHEAAYLLGLFALLSQILGLFRDRLFASYFGPSEILDVYYASFRIPDFLFVIVIALVSSSVLIPFIVKFIDLKDESKIQDFLNSIFSALIIFSLSLSILVFIGAEWILKMLVPDILAGNYGTELIIMTKVLLLQPVLLAISGLFGSIVQSYRKFVIYALSPIVYNFGIIMGIIFLYPRFGVLGLSFGVVIGAVLHFIIQIPFVKKKGNVPIFTTKIDWKSVRDVFFLSIPRTIALTSSQVVQLIFVAIASTMAVGSISIFNLAYNLQAVPLAIIGVSYSLAAFPTLAHYFLNGETENFLSCISRAARHIIFWSIPIMIMFIVLRAQIVRTILGGGEFSWNDTSLVAASLAVFAVSVVAQSLIVLFVRSYYACGETRKPFMIATVSTTITIVLAFIFTALFTSDSAFKGFIESLLRVKGIPGTVVLMLPLSYAIGQLAHLFLLWISFDRTFKKFSDNLWKIIFHSFGSSLIMGYVTFLGLNILDDVFDINTFWGIFSQGFFAGAVGICAGSMVLIFLGNEEFKVVVKTFHSKIWKAKLVVAEADDLT